MANYISALNGEQMDAALTDVALHNSEAWAVGTRNTIPVSSSDETYQNNSKYYAQLAQSVIPGTYTAAVRWDIAQGLAGEAQEQARANISAGASNRNLLDNPFFSVNQRGVTSELVDSIRLFTDRWKSTSGNTVTINSNGLTMTSNANTHQNLMQGITNETFAGWAGKTLTASAMTQSGVITSRTFTCPTSIASGSVVNVGSISIDGASFVIYLGHERDFTTQYGFWLYSSTTGATVRYRAVKLELGSYSTLANDVPPDYGEELRKCQRYFYRMDGSAANYTSYGFCVAVNTTTAELFVNTPVVMRTTPTVSYSGTFQLRDYAGGNTRAISAMGVDTRASTTLKVAITATSLTLGWLMQLRGAASATYIDFSADL